MIYRDNVEAYRSRDWRCVLPLPAQAKYPPPTGWTGAEASEPDDAMIEAWSLNQPDANIALRMPNNVIGIDVDAYDDKHGNITLHTAEVLYGDLPRTWSSTARGQDSAARIYLYRVPPTARFPGKLEIDGHSDVEIIQARHRYMVAPPSVHPDGMVYRWYGPDGKPSSPSYPVSPPYVDELPNLPQSWLDALTLDGPGALKRAMTADAASSFLARLPGWLDEKPCFELKARLARSIQRLDDEGSRHDSAVQDTLAMLGLAVAGHRGGWQAFARYRQAFIAAIGPARGDKVADAEFERMFKGAVELVADEPLGLPCHCDDAFSKPAPDPTAPSEDEITTEVRNQKKRRIAKLRIAAEEARTTLEVPRFTDGRTFVWEADNELSWRIDNMVERGATVGFFAAAKVGKSTVLGNLAHALLTGEPFLGTYNVTPVERCVTLVDLELSANRLRSWLKRWGNADKRLKVTSLRGQAANFNITDETHFARLVEELKAQDTEVLIVDPLGPLLRALSLDENDPSEVGSILDRFSALKEAAGIGEIIVSHHAGHDNKDRPRGASTFMDWPDVMLLLRLKGSGKFSDEASLLKAPRVLSAVGRDVDVPSIELVYDPESGEVTARAKAEQDTLGSDVLLSAVVDAARETPGITQRKLKTALRQRGIAFSDGQIPDVVSRAIEQQYITRRRDADGRVIGLFILDS